MNVLIWSALVLTTVVFAFAIRRAIHSGGERRRSRASFVLSGALVVGAVMGLTYGYPFWPHPVILLTLAVAVLVKWGIWDRRQEQHRT